jgi:tetratricopeptide (TPR) repeat protein
MKKKVFFFLFLVLLSNPVLLMAQTETEQIIPETDKFEEFFYESLLQKGIENYDKAISALEQCLKLKPNNAIVYFEIGKNQLALKQYDKAYNAFEQATQIDPKNKWYWVGMYDASTQNKDNIKVLMTVNKLIEFDEIYKEDLISIYMNTQQFDKALAFINELNDKTGKSDRRDFYKRTIMAQGKYQSAEIENLKEQINKYPKNESNYIALIKLYTENNEEQKALEITQKLETEIPSSEWAQVGLFKNYLVINEWKKAINSMNIVLASTKMDAKIKHRILNEFLIFVNTNPEYGSDLEKAISYFDKDLDVNVAKKIGIYYHSKKQWDKAIQYYERTLKSNFTEDVETNLLLLQAYVETKQFEIIAKKTTSLIEVFPIQAQFYYFSGMANNQIQQFKKAKDILEMGMDYVIDDLPLEINFNIQLGEAYNGLGDFKKKELYFNKANQLLKK